MCNFNVLNTKFVSSCVLPVSSGKAIAVHYEGRLINVVQGNNLCSAYAKHINNAECLNVKAAGA